MQIISSSVTVTQEVDGRWRVEEQHIDADGNTHTFSYLCPASFDVAARLAAKAAELPAMARASEIAANLLEITSRGSLAQISRKHSTAAQNATAIRAAYKEATERQAVMIGDFLASLSDAQLQFAFGITAGQVTTIRTNILTPAAATAATLRAAVGT